MDRSRCFVLGLGYVGLPLAMRLAEHFETFGYDASHARLAELRSGVDRSRCLGTTRIQLPDNLRTSSELEPLSQADFVFVCVPTPVDEQGVPDLGQLTEATRLVGRHLRRGAVVVYESTVYPGATEEHCAPLLEQESGLVWKRDFHVAYSPERINPGDPEHGLAEVVKVVAGDHPSTLEAVSALYRRIVDAGVHRAPSIRAAEAAKLVENIQRDVNIALMNELSSTLSALELDTREVLAIAATKWNFLPFEPGLVGGHCVGVDPYYMDHVAGRAGIEMPLLRTARNINESMARLWASRFLENIGASGADPPPQVSVLGLSFKPNTSDMRNSKALEFVAVLKEAGCRVACCDPLVAREDVARKWGLEMYEPERLPRGVDAIACLVPHDELLGHPMDAFLKTLAPGGLVFDLRGSFDRAAVESAGYRLLVP